VSTDRQATEGLSLGEQERRVRAHIDAQGWELVEVFVDAGISGKRDDRPALLAMLGRLDEFDVLVVPKLDRLGRSAAHLWRVYGELERAEVALVSMADGFDTTTAAGRLLRAVLSAVAELEADTISERVRSVIGVRARAGKPHGGPSAYGFRYADDGALVHDDREAVTVRQVFERFVAGESQRAIQRDLNRRKVPTRRGGPWHQGNIAKMLRNPAYVGRVRLNGETYDGLHSAVVTPEVWEAAQRLLRPSTAGTRGRPTAGRHLFAKGLLRCGGCGASMVPRTVRSGKGRRSAYEVYVCYQHLSDHDACTRVAVKRAPLDDAVVRYFENVAVDVEATRAHVLQRLNQHHADTAAELRRARRDLGEKIEQRARVERDYLAGELPAVDYGALRAKLDEDQVAVRAEVERLSDRLASLDETAIMGELDAGGLADLAAIRDAIAAQLRSAHGVLEVRAGLRRLFDSFVLHQAFDAADVVSEDLEFGGEVAPGESRWWLEPRVRGDAIEGFERLVKWDPELGDLPDGSSTAVRPRLKRLAIALDIDNDGVVT
jgi:site-specific DNA recombinase